MTQDEKKRAVAKFATSFIAEEKILGVGTGSTANYFIEALAPFKDQIPGAVASSLETERQLRRVGIALVELNEIDSLSLYVDGADEADLRRHLIKGGGGALTREKIIAAAAECFVCMIDDTKLRAELGEYPLPIEVIPMASRYVSRQLCALGGKVVERVGFITDNGNAILDVQGLSMADPVALEWELNQIAGIVGVGLFAQRPADVLLIANDHGIERR